MIKILTDYVVINQKLTDNNNHVDHYQTYHDCMENVGVQNLFHIPSPPPTSDNVNDSNLKSKIVFTNCLSDLLSSAKEGA